MSEAERNEHLAAHAESCDDSDRIYERCPVCAPLRQNYVETQILGGAGAAFRRFQYLAGQLEIGEDPDDYDRTDSNAITVADRGFAAFTVYVVYTVASRDLVTGSSVSVSQFLDRTFLVTGNEIYDGEAEQHLIASSANVG